MGGGAGGVRERRLAVGRLAAAEMRQQHAAGWGGGGALHAAIRGLAVAALPGAERGTVAACVFQVESV